jgi:hypothetical protein
MQSRQTNSPGGYPAELLLDLPSGGGILPPSARRGFDHPPEHAPAHVGIRPETARRAARGGIGHQPGKRAVVLILPVGEAELQPGAQRKPGTIRQQVAERRAPA